MGRKASRSPSPSAEGSALTVGRLEANIKTIYAIELLRWCLLTSSLEAAFFETYGMSASQNALGLLTYSATNTLVELPSGWLADTVGRKKILVASAMLWGAGYMTHCFGSFQWVLLGELTIALGVSAGSGSDEALVFETVRELTRLRRAPRRAKPSAEDEAVGAEVTTVLSMMGFLRNISSFGGVILGGIVLHIASRASFPYLWFAEGLKYALVAALYASLCDPYMEMGGMAAAIERASPSKDTPGGKAQAAADAAESATLSGAWRAVCGFSARVWQQPSLLRLLLDSSVGETCNFLGMKWASLYYVELCLQPPAWVYGLIYAMLKLCAAAGARLAPRVSAHSSWEGGGESGRQWLAAGLGCGWAGTVLALRLSGVAVGEPDAVVQDFAARYLNPPPHMSTRRLT